MEGTINAAIQKGFFQQIRFLLEFGYDTNEREPGSGRTPLINCALVEDETWAVGIARMLLEYHASIGHKDRHGLNALHYACLLEKTRLAAVYIEALSFDLNAVDRQGNTALYYAVSAGGNPQLISLLIDSMLKYRLSVDKPNKKGVTPLILAYQTRDLRAAKILVEQGGADKDIKDLVEGKSGHEWEQEALAAQEQEQQEQASARAKRPRTAFMRLASAPQQQAAARTSPTGRPNTAHPRAGRLSRVPSAPLLRRRQNSAAAMAGGAKEDKENAPEIMDRTRMSHKLFRSASAGDLRNKPEYILQVSPLEYFTADRHNNILGNKGELVQQEDGSWRVAIKTLYNKFDFQFTKSYRTAAKPPEPGAGGLAASGLLVGLQPLRALSPNPSEADSSKKGSLRRASVRSPTSSEVGRRQRIGSAVGKMGSILNTMKRGSSLGAVGAQQQPVPGGSKANTSGAQPPLGGTDSSSNESVNSIPKGQLQQQKKKASAAAAGVDDSSETSSSSSKGDKDRPVSRATNHPTTAAKKDLNLTAIKE